MESLNLLSSKTPGIIKVIKQQYSETSNTTAHQGNYKFKLNHNMGNLKQLYIKATLTRAGAITPTLPLAPLLLKTITLRTDTTTLQTITPTYTLSRIDMLSGTGLANKLAAGINAGSAGTFPGTVVVFMPLFFWFSDDATNPLELFGRKQLYVEITENSQHDMGINNPLDTSFYELISVFEQKESYPKVPRQIRNSYDIFIEDTQTITATQTTATFRLRCPYEVFAVSFLFLTGNVVGGTFSKNQITKIKVDTPTSTLFDIDIYTNYLLSDNPNSGIQLNSTSTINFGIRGTFMNWTDPSNYIRFSQNLSPTFVTLTFANSGYDGNLYTISHHNTSLVTDEYGQIHKEITGVF